MASADDIDWEWEELLALAAPHPDVGDSAAMEQRAAPDEESDDDWAQLLAVARVPGIN